MDWRAKLDSAKTATSSARQAGGGLVDEAIEQHWPTIQQALRESVMPTASGVIADDAVIERAVGIVHSLLPFPVRLVIRRPRLTEWCLSNRPRVLAALERDTQS